MKSAYYVFLFALLIPSITNGQQQETFRLDYTLFSIYENGEWGELREGKNTFVFNANNGADVIHYMGGGEKVVYRSLSAPAIDYAETKGKYQYMLLLDGEGVEMYIQVFFNTEYGLKMIYNEDFMINFLK